MKHSDGRRTTVSCTPEFQNIFFDAAEYAAEHGDVDSTVKFLYLVEQAAHWVRQEMDRERVRAIKELLQNKLQAKELGARSN